jgi:hypothetical protein
MARLSEHIEHVRRRLTEITETEEVLIRALDEALARIDQKLLREVRDVTAAHEARRGAILAELEALAVRIGAFPSPHEAIDALEEAPRHTLTAQEAEPPMRRGDWREAAKNIERDLEVANYAVNGYAEAY